MHGSLWSRIYVGLSDDALVTASGYGDTGVNLAGLLKA